MLQALLQTAETASHKLEQRAQAILGHKPKISGKDSKSLRPVVKPPKAAAYDLAAFKAGGCDCAINMAFTAAEAKAAGCDLATAKSLGYDVSSLVIGFGVDAVTAAGYDTSSIILVSRTQATTDTHTPRKLPNPQTPKLKLLNPIPQTPYHKS